MAIDISCPNRNHRVARMNRCEQAFGRAGCASVVRNLKQHRVGMLFHHPAFGSALRISLEQRSRRTESGAKDQAIVIWPHRARYLVSSRSQHMKMCSTVVELVSLFLY